MVTATDLTLRDETREKETLLALLGALKEADYRFVTVTPATHARVNQRADATWARDLRDIFGWNRPFKTELLPRGLFDLLHAGGVLEPDGAGWRSRLRVASLGDALLLHSAYPTAQSDAVFFGPDSYRFCNAIEAHLSRRQAPVRRALDIGCGAGPGALTVAVARPEAKVLATDINPAALRLASVNLAFAGARNVRLCESNLFAQVDGAFDLIVANPPYLLDPAERSYRHGGGHLGAGLSVTIADAAIDHLAPGGSLLLYTGVAMLGPEDPFIEALRPRLARSGLEWSYRELDPDVFGEELACDPYAGAERIAAVLLHVTNNGAAS